MIFFDDYDIPIAKDLVQLLKANGQEMSAELASIAGKSDTGMEQGFTNLLDPTAEAVEGGPTGQGDNSEFRKRHDENQGIVKLF